MDVRTRTKHTLSVEGVSWLEQLYDFLVTSNVDTPHHDILVPDTAVFRYQRPAALYFNEDRVLRSSHELGDLSADALLHRFTSKDAAPDRICATYVYINRDHRSERSDTQDVVVEYMNTEQLEFFLKHRTKHNNGILQRFVPSKGAYHTIIRVMWTPRTCHIETRSNKHRMDDSKVQMEDRIKTFDGSPELSVSHTLRDGLFYGRIKDSVVDLVRHVESLVQRNYHVWETVFYFKYSQPEKGSEEKTGLTFLWCSSMRLYKDELLDLQRLDQFWASDMKTERLLSKVAPDRERKALACPLSGTVYEPGKEVKVAVTTIVKYLQTLADAPKPTADAIQYMQDVTDLDDNAANEELLVARRGRDFNEETLNEEVTAMVEGEHNGKTIADLIKRAVFGSPPSAQEADRLRLILKHPKFLAHQIAVCEDVALKSALVVTQESVRTRTRTRGKSATERAKLSTPLLMMKKGSASGILAPSSVIEVKNIQVGLLNNGGGKIAGSKGVGSKSKMSTISSGARPWHSSQLDAVADSRIFALRRQRYLPLGRRQAEVVAKGQGQRARAMPERAEEDSEDGRVPARLGSVVAAQKRSTHASSVLASASRAGSGAQQGYDEWVRAASGGRKTPAGYDELVRAVSAGRAGADEKGEAVPRSSGGHGAGAAGRPISPAEIAALQKEWEGGRQGSRRGTRRMLEAPQQRGSPASRGGEAGGVDGGGGSGAGGRGKVRREERCKAAVLGQYSAFQRLEASTEEGGEAALPPESGTEGADDAAATSDSGGGAGRRRGQRGPCAVDHTAFASTMPGLSGRAAPGGHWQAQREASSDGEGGEELEEEESSAEEEEDVLGQHRQRARDPDPPSRGTMLSRGPAELGPTPKQLRAERGVREGGALARPMSAKAELTGWQRGGGATRASTRPWSARASIDAWEARTEWREGGAQAQAPGRAQGSEEEEDEERGQEAGAGRGWGERQEQRQRPSSKQKQPGMDRAWSAGMRERQQSAESRGRSAGGMGDEWSEGDLIDDDDEDDWDDGLEMDLPSTFKKLRESQELRMSKPNRSWMLGKQREAAAGGPARREALQHTADDGAPRLRDSGALLVGAASGGRSRQQAGGGGGGKARTPLFLQWEQDERAKSKVLEQYSAFAAS